MANGNKFNNGVWEQGTPEIVLAYQHDTPGQKVEEYVEGLQLQNEKKKLNAKKQFTQVFDNPLKGFPYNEEFEVKEIKEEAELTENYRKLAKHGMGTETPKSIKVGTEIDYYQKDGAKYMGKVTKMSKQSYTVRDDKTKKDHEFFYHDRIKAAKLLKQGDNIEEKVDPKVLKAIEIAMKMGGNMTGAVKAIEKIKKNLSKHKDVMNALQFANESKLPDFEVSFIEEDYRKVIKMYPSDKEWKKLITKHRKAIDAFRKDNVDLPMKVEDELIGWASETGEVSGKHDAEDFIISILDESIEKNMTLSLLEKAYDQNDVKKVQQLEKKLQGMLKEVEKTMKGSGLSAPAFNNVRSGIVKGLESIEKFYKIANTSSEESSSAQQAAIAIAKKGKEKNESIMNTYRNVWEESLQEEMISYRVKGMQKPEEDKFKQSAKMMGLKITMDKGKKDTVIVMSGTKKKLRDFDSIARGKSSYGDPSTIMHFDEK